jgi:energy-coupling factor transporter ATP-binding protein EcfA2
MMSTPTVVQLITAIREQLSDVIAPALDDTGARKLLAMIDHLLQTIAVRAEHEIDWMVSHIDAVVSLAATLVAAGDEGDAHAAVASALRRYHQDKKPSLAASAVTENYALAGEVLSVVLEATVSDDGPLALRARELLGRDVEHGVDIVGEFELVPP